MIGEEAEEEGKHEAMIIKFNKKTNSCGSSNYELASASALAQTPGHSNHLTTAVN